jgi:hypothetical protein
VTYPSLTVHDLHEPRTLLVASHGKYPRQSPDEHFAHLLSGHSFRRVEDEASCAELDDSDLLARLAPNPFILRQDDPPSSSRFLEPPSSSVS